MADRSPLTREEAVEILTKLARTGPDHVKVGAIRELSRIREDEEQGQTPFDRIDGASGGGPVDLAQRRARKRPRAN